MKQRKTPMIVSFLLAGSLLLSSCSGSGMNGMNFDISGLTEIYQKGKRLISATEGLTPEQQYYLGRGVAANIFTSYKPYGALGSSLNRYVNQVGQDLVAFSDMPYTYKGYYFLVLNSHELNAFATPGGYIFVTKGLIQSMPDEDALAGVLAHEIAHVVLCHGVGAVETSILTDVVTSTGLEIAEDQGGGVTQAVLSLTKSLGVAIDEVTETLLVNGYSRSQEYSADEYAAELLVRAGYNPSGLTDMLKQIEKVEKSSTKSDGFMATHPPAEDRLEEVEDLDIFEGMKEDEKDPGRILRAKRFHSRVKSLG